MCNNIGQVCWRRRTRIPLRLYLVPAVSIVTFMIILPMLLKDNPYSPYYKLFERNQTKSERVSQYKRDNDRRILRSEAIIASLSTQDEASELMTSWNRHAQYKLLVTIITLSRNQYEFQSTDNYQPKYLTQTFARLVELKLLRKSNLTDFQVLICNVDTNEHAELSKLKPFSLLAQVYNGDSDSVAEDKYEREKLDLVACLQHSIPMEADYILMIEDDAFPNEDLLQQLDHLFSYRLRETELANLGFVKLFHPTRLSGYITADINRLLEWFAIASLLEHLLLLLQYLFVKDFRYSAVQRFLWYVYFVVLVLVVGRPNIIGFRELSPFLHRLVPAPSCCTPASIYTPNSARVMMKYLKSVTCKQGFAKDTAMDYFSEKTGLSTWFFEPKLFSHIGVYTTRRKSVVDPLVVD